MSKRWITAAVVTAIAGGALGVVLSSGLEQQPELAKEAPASLPETAPQALTANTPSPAKQSAAASTELQPQPAATAQAQAQVELWNAQSLEEREQDGIIQHHTQVDPQQLAGLHIGQEVALALPGRSSPTRATLGETRNTAGSAVWHGSLIDGDEVESMTLVKGALETHITVATLDGSLSIIIDNATGKTVITDENQLVLRADPNDHLHYDHKELAPLPPPAQG